MDQIIGTIIAAAVPTLAVIAAFVRNESAIVSLGGRLETLNRDMNARFSDVNARFSDVNARIDNLTRDMNARFETLTRRIDSVDSDLREWAQISMQHNTDIARLKDKTGL